MAKKRSVGRAVLSSFAGRRREKPAPLSRLPVANGVFGRSSRSCAITVNIWLDEQDGHIDDGDISLRDAVRAASVSDTINFDSSLAGHTITLDHGLGEIAFSKSLTIDGTDGNGNSLGITIDADNPTPNDPNDPDTLGDGIRIFNITNTSQNQADPPLVTLVGLTLKGGDPNLYDGYSGVGGAIRSEAMLVLDHCTITDNQAQGTGGALSIQVGGGSPTLQREILKIEDCVISDNHATTDGGGLWIRYSYINTADTISIVRTDISNNAVNGNGYGGGIYAELYEQHLLIDDSTIESNHAETGWGGGIFFAGSNALLNITSSTISGNVGQLGGGIGASASGGAIRIDKSTFENNTTDFGGEGGAAYIVPNAAVLTITDSTVSNNHAQGFEANVGGLFISAVGSNTVVLDGVRILDNHADDDVGGLGIINQFSEVTVKNSTIAGNSASFNSGTFQSGVGVAILASGFANATASTTIANSTISGNKFFAAPDSGSNATGGGLNIRNTLYAPITLINTTISGNEVQGSGGGIEIEVQSNAFYGPGPVYIQHCTITENRSNVDNDSSGTGGGIDISDPGISVFLDHTIVAKNWNGPGTTTEDDINGTPTSTTYSLIGDNSNTSLTPATVASPDIHGNMIGTHASPIDPNLADLAWNGGPTETHRPNAGSPVINMGNPTTTGFPEFDQRGDGFTRVSGGRIDIGAYEIGLPKVIDVRVFGSGWCANRIPTPNS